MRSGSGLGRFLLVGMLFVAGLSLDPSMVRAQHSGDAKTGRAVAEAGEPFTVADRWPGAASVTDVVVSVVLLATVIVLASRRPRSRKLQWFVVAKMMR